jgi:hypothetical protein
MNIELLCGPEVFNPVLSLQLLKSGKGLANIPAATAPKISEPADMLNKKPEEIGLMEKEIAYLRERVQTLEKELDLAQNSKKEVRIQNACIEHRRKHQKCPAECQGRKRSSSKKRKQRKYDTEEEDEF